MGRGEARPQNKRMQVTARKFTEPDPPRSLRKKEMINVAFVTGWSAKYPVSYDTLHYDPYIKAARAGDADALRRLTEWKNVGKGPRPMKLWKPQEKAFQ